MALGENKPKKPNLDEVIKNKVNTAFDFKEKPKALTEKDKELIQIATRIESWVLKKMNEKYEARGLKPAQWIRMLIMEDLDK